MSEWHDSFTYKMPYSYVTWFIHTWHDSFTRDTPFVSNRKRWGRICDTIYSYMTWRYVTCERVIWHDVWLIRCYVDTWQVFYEQSARPSAWRNSFTHGMSFISNLKRPGFIWHDSFIHDMTWLIHTCNASFMCVTRFIHTLHVSLSRDRSFMSDLLDPLRLAFSSSWSHSSTPNSKPFISNLLDPLHLAFSGSWSRSSTPNSKPVTSNLLGFGQVFIHIHTCFYIHIHIYV